MGKLPTVLVVEDDPNDALLFCCGLKRKSIRAQPQVINDGQEAIRYLRGEGVYQDRAAYPLPGLVILDLHIPGSSGLAVLRWIRKQPSLSGLPVVVFTGTDDGNSFQDAMESGADTYLFKSHDMEGLLHLLEHADLAWNTRPPTRDLQKP
jgi:DNA-binding response OmpR family regulator